MIPVSLTIKGLYSYQKEQTIDFSRLLEGQLFGIFGAVGSGKSSILEAISYALYGDTERLNRTDNRSYNMMNLRSNELLIDFTFVNYDTFTYRFVVRGKRNSKNHEKVGTLERTSYKQVNGVWEPLDGANGEQVIGLSYDNFRRTIIIPQGKFQEFLQLGDKDRTVMLREIFQLEKYEFFYQAVSLEKKNSEHIQRLTGELANYNTVTLEEIEASKERLNVLSNAVKDIKANLDNKVLLLQAMEKLKLSYQEYQSYGLQLQELHDRKNYFEELKASIARFNFCMLHFRADLLQHAKLKQDRGQLDQDLSLLIKSLDDINKKLIINQKKYDLLKQDFDQLDNWKLKLGDYDRSIAVRKLDTDLLELQQRIAKGQAILDDKEGEKLRLSEQVEQLAAEIKKRNQELPDYGLLSQLRQWYLTNKHLKNTLILDEQDYEKAKHQVQENVKLLDELNFESILINSDIKSGVSLKLIRNLLENVAQEEQNASAKLAHYQLQLKLGEFSSHLHQGNACPLCGSLEHPQILQAEDVQQEFETIQKDIEAFKVKKKALEGLLLKVSSLELSLEKSREIEEKSLQKQRNSLAALQEHQKSFVWGGFKPDDEAKLDELEQNARKEKEYITALENSLEQKRTSAKEVEGVLLKYKTALDKLQLDYREKNGQSSLLKQQIQEQHLSVLSQFSLEELQAEKLLLEQQIVDVQQNHDQLKLEIEAFNNQIISLKERINALEVRRKTLEQEYQHLEQAFEVKLKESGFGTLEEVRVVLNQNLNIPVLEKELHDYQLKLYNAEQNYQRLSKELENQAFDENQFVLLKTEVTELQSAFQKQHEEQIREQVFLKNQEAGLQKKTALLKELESLQLRGQNIDQLKNLFRSSGFVNYISSFYLNQLCAAANERFYKLSKQQLKLELSDKNDFLIRDYLNDGKLRSVKTLSGGQTFQASLSLALALAESVQKQNKSEQNFFFLDEGFGSLDKEALQTAFETLKSLRKENRIVGVISHVEDLQQEIDVFLQVKNDSAEGSLIKGNWE